jgi:hypothetical protein
LITPSDPIDALAALEPEVLPRRRELSPRMQQLLEYGDMHGEFTSRSEVIQALAVAAVNCRWQFSEFFEALMRHVGGEKIHGRRDARAYALRSFRKAVDLVRRSRPISRRGEKMGRIRTLQAEADQTTWWGMSGATDKAVLDAHLALASRVGSLDYTASARQMPRLPDLGFGAWSRLTSGCSTGNGSPWSEKATEHRLVNGGSESLRPPLHHYILILGV